MAIGIVELALLLVVGTAAGVALFTGKQKWLIPMFGFCVIATLFSPADVFSTVVAALSVFAIHRFTMKRTLQAH